MNIIISRLDYNNSLGKNMREGSYACLPALTDINAIEDVNQVKSINIYFDTKIEAEELAAKFPKSYKAKVHTVGQMSGVTVYCVHFNFATFWKNNVTGSLNETAINNRLKVIAKIKSL